MSTVYRSFVEKLGGSSAASFVGNKGELFWDPESSTLRISDGSTPGGLQVSGGGTGGLASGVSSIIAGSGISVDQATGDVTVTATVTGGTGAQSPNCLLYTSPSPRDRSLSRMPSSA